MALYRGFSTVDQVRAPFELFDEEIVIRDLLNEIHTRKGERPMLPEFGSIVHDLIMEPEDAATEDEILEDISRIIDKESRVENQGIRIQRSGHAIRIEVDLKFRIVGTEQTMVTELLENT